MTYRFLPFFEKGIQVSADNARQDKIRVSFGNWHFMDMGDEALNAANEIAQELHPVPSRSNDETRRIFRNIRRLGYRSAQVQFSKQRINDAEGPLHGLPLARGIIEFHDRGLGGELPFPEIEMMRLRTELEAYWQRRNEAEDQGIEFDEEEPANPDDFGPTGYRIDASLTLNPTRMMNHQRFEYVYGQLNNPDFEYPDIQLLTAKRGVMSGDEFTLANHDNVILQARNHRMSGPPHYRELRYKYFQAWLDFIHQRLEYQLDDPDDERFSFEPRFSLSNVENYHEFRCDTPLQAIEALRPFIRTLGQSVRNLRITDWSQADYLDGNEIGYRVDIAQGLEFVIYAKTNKRVRIEARTDLSERLKDRSFPHTRQTTDSLEGVFNLIDATTEDAASYVNQALAALNPGLPGEDPANQQITQAPPYELVREIMRAVSDEHRDLDDNADNRRLIASAQQLLVSLIVVRNSCALPPQQRLARAAARLQRRGVLEAPNSGHVRPLAAKYQNARNILLAEYHGGV